MVGVRGSDGGRARAGLCTRERVSERGGRTQMERQKCTMHRTRCPIPTEWEHITCRFVICTSPPPGGELKTFNLLRE